MKYLIITLLPLLLYNCSRLPNGKSGEDADQLTRKIFKATGQQHWEQANIVKWTFDENHEHVWDRERNMVKVSWGEVIVVENLNSKEGQVWLEGELYNGEEKKEYLDKAYNYWANDSYWLNPFWKFFEDGVERKLVDYKGDKALLITHTSGGDTPGDSYLWLLDPNGLPYAWKLWVKIIPIKGYRFSWGDWVTLSNGLKISRLHKSKFSDISISNLEVGESVQEMFGSEDPFSRTLK